MEKEKKTKKKRVRKAEKKVSLLTWIFLALANLAALTILVAVNGFTVKKVIVENNQLYDDTVIENAVLNDDYSWNVLYVYAKYQFKETDEIPFVDSLDVSIADRNTLIIHVNEKAMLGYLYLSSQKKNAYFDVDGYVAEISDRVIPDIPKIEGLECDEVTAYEQLPIQESKLKNLLAVTQALKRNDLVPETVTYGVDQEPQLTFGDVSVLVGSTTGLAQKIERLAAILPSLDGKRGTLHLENWSEQTSNIIFDDADKAAEAESEETEDRDGSGENAGDEASENADQTEDGQ